jgi:hypothetical protein
MMINSNPLSACFSNWYILMLSGWIIIVTAVLPACQPEERKQTTDAQAADTLSKEGNRKKLDQSVNRPVFPGADAIQQDCKFVQDQAEALLEEYHRNGTADERLRQIVVELEKLNREWKEKDCQQVFGFMIPEIPSLPPAGHRK